MHQLRFVLFFGLLFGLKAPAQILINEVHGFGGGADPSLPSDYLELWNQSGVNIDLQGYTIGVWSGDGGTVSTVVIPCTNDGRHIIPAHGFWVLAESAPFLGEPHIGSLAGIHGMRGLPGVWSSLSSMGAYLLTPGGQCVDYVYLRRSAPPQPVFPPNLVPPCTWTVGSIAASGSGNAHIHRLTNSNTSSVIDWAHNPTITRGTPGAENTILGAMQTPTGPRGMITGGGIAWETNDPASALEVFGIPSLGSEPLRYLSTCQEDLPLADFRSTNLGLPFDVAVAATGTVIGNTRCQPGTCGFNTSGGQVLNLNLFDPTLFWLNGLTFAVPFFANFSAALPSNSLLTLQAQMLNIDPANPDLFALSAAIEYTATASGNIQVTLPRNNDANVNLDLADLCGISGIDFFGTTYTNIWCSPNGRALFGANGDTDATATPGEGRTDNPWVGFWTDLNPAATTTANAAWTIQNTGPIVTLRWSDIAYAGTNVPLSFEIHFDTLNDDVIIEWTAIPANPAAAGGGDAQMLGISGGATNGASLGSSTAFNSGVSGTGLLATDMLYEYWNGTAATAPGGMNRLASFGTANGVRFSWNGARYTFLGL